MTPITWVAAVTVKLPYPVSANRYWRTRVVLPSMDKIAAAMKQGGLKGLCKFIADHSFVNTYVSTEAKNYKEAVGWLLRNAGVRQQLTGWVRIDLQLRPACPKDWAKRQRQDQLWWASTVQRLDLDNTRKVVYDAIKGIAIEDDKQVWKDTGEVLEPQEGTDPYVVVRISRAVRDNPQKGLEL